MTYFATTEEMESRIADLSAQIQQQMADQPAPDLTAPEAPPPGHSPVEGMKWARRHGQVKPEFTLTEQPMPTVIPPEILALPPIERAKWVRRWQRAGV